LQITKISEFLRNYFYTKQVTNRQPIPSQLPVLRFRSLHSFILKGKEVVKIENDRINWR